MGHYALIVSVARNNLLKQLHCIATCVFTMINFPYFSLLYLFISPCLLQAVMPSPVSELRSPNIKHHEGSFLEDYTFQQATPYIHALRDSVCNRVTLVGYFVCEF